MHNAEPTPYDAVHYPGLPFSQTHPDRLATLAALHGLKSAPPGHCRVLELGCGNGGNLIPMAYALRDSTFVGLDVAGSAVALGQEQIAELGLPNVKLLHADLLDVSGLDRFDYVIAHGLYSWVPRAVQERIFAIVADVLAPNGVAFVSYNALPGCHIRNAVREMMRWHVRDIEDPVEQIGQARGLIRFLAEASPRRPVLSAILNETLEHQAKQPDPVLFHDDLADVNEPLLFVDFVARAGRHRLQFLSEADYCDMAVWDAGSPAGRFLLGFGAADVVVQQQYRDFLTFRRFRQTLLCRGEVALEREPNPDILRSLFVGANTRPKDRAPDMASDEPTCFVGEKDRELTTPHPLSKAAFLELGEIWPSWVSIPDLLAAARARLRDAGGRSAGAEDETRLFRFLIASYGAEMAQLRSAPCPFVTDVSEHPRASSLARHQARSQSKVTNLRHQSVQLEDPFVRIFLGLLDGTRDRGGIESEMAAALREDPATAPLAADVRAAVDLNFGRVSGLALLEG